MSKVKRSRDQEIAIIMELQRQGRLRKRAGDFQGNTSGIYRSGGVYTPRQYQYDVELGKKIIKNTAKGIGGAALSYGIYRFGKPVFLRALFKSLKKVQKVNKGFVKRGKKVDDWLANFFGITKKPKKVSKPKLSKPKLSKPKVSKPKVSKPKVSKPKLSKPKVSKPKAKKRQIKVPTKDHVFPKSFEETLKKPGVAKKVIEKNKSIKKNKNIEPKSTFLNLRKELENWSESLAKKYSTNDKVKRNAILIKANDYMVKGVYKSLKEVEKELFGKYGL